MKFSGLTLNLLLLALIGLGEVSCNGEKLEELQKLNEIVNNFPQITQIRPSTMSRRKINSHEICDDLIKPCDSGEIYYKEILKQIDLSIEDYKKIDQALIDAEVRSYLWHPRFSTYIKSGAFGDIFGLLIDKSPGEDLPEKFDLNSRYTIYIGNSILPNVYYFSN